jgi:polyisoprenoid-binding protein YceI
MRKLFFIVFILSVFIPATARAAADKYIYDPAHTQIMFSISHLGFSFPHGRFNKFSGSFTFDQENPEVSQAEITIDVDGLDMASAEWDKHLKSPDFFNAEKFPTMTFKSTKVVKTGDKTSDLTGDFTLLGVTRPVTLQVTFNKADTFPMNKNYVAGFSLSGALKRSDFNMTHALPMVGDDVSLIIQVEGIRQDFEKLSK